MKRMMSGAVVFTAVLALAPLHMAAQQGPRAQRAQAMGARGGGVEMILRQRQTLELTENQIKQLDQIRQEAVQRRTAHQAEMAELRSKVMAGDMEPAALQEQVEARRIAAQAIQKGQQERVQAVLTDAQKQKIQQWTAQARAFQRGRMSALRGDRPGMRQGMRGRFLPGRQLRNPGFQGGPGMMGPRRGQGMGPGMMGPGMGREMGPGMGPGMGHMGGRRGPGGGLGFGPQRDTIPSK